MCMYCRVLMSKDFRRYAAGETRTDGSRTIGVQTDSVPGWDRYSIVTFYESETRSTSPSPASPSSTPDFAGTANTVLNLLKVRRLLRRQTLSVMQTVGEGDKEDAGVSEKVEVEEPDSDDKTESAEKMMFGSIGRLRGKSPWKRETV